MNKESALINENVIRRWGKLAAMAPLTENYLDTVTEEEVEMEDEVEVEMGAEMDMGDDDSMEMDAAAPELDLSADQVEMLVVGIADKLSELTGEDIDVQSDDEVEMDAEVEVDAEVDMGDLADDAAGRDDMAYNRDDEELNLEVVDDEGLTEAVLKRVVERLLSRQ